MNIGYQELKNKNFLLILPTTFTCVKLTINSGVKLN